MAQRRSPEKGASGSPLAQALRTARIGFLTAGIFSLFVNLLLLVSPLYMLQVYDRVLSSGHRETLILLTLMAAVALAVLGLLDALRGYVLTRIGLWLDQTLADRLVARSVEQSLAGERIGAQALRDLSSLRGFVGGPAITAFFDAPWMPIFIGFIWLLHPWLGMLAVITAIVLFALAVVNEVATRAPLAAANRASIHANRSAELAVRNAEVVQAMGILPGFLARWHKTTETVLSHQRVASDRASALGGLSKFARLMAQTLVLGLGAYLVLGGEATPGSMIAASILLGRALVPVEQAIGGWRQFVGARDAYRRLETLLSVPPQPPAMALPRPTGRIDMENVLFAPPGSQKPTIRRVTATIQPGTVTAIVGPSGAGKSTLCRLLVGAWKPTAGSVRLDGAEVHRWDRSDFGRHVGYLPQDVELFDGTIADNIARLGEANPELVVEAAQRADVHDMILRLDKGYETDIGDGGQIMSGGQRQRIGLARALYGTPRVMILDEPAANLDTDGENALQKAIAAIKAEGSTVIMVAHRPSLLTHVDQVLVMHDGVVTEAGPRDEVLRKIMPSRGPTVVAGSAASG